MGERTNYTPGTFCWTDLTTTDQGAAKAFYSGLFGWKAEDLPVGEGFVYSMMRLNGKDVAAIVPIEDLEAIELLEDRMDLKEVKKRLDWSV